MHYVLLLAYLKSVRTICKLEIQDKGKVRMHLYELVRHVYLILDTLITSTFKLSRSKGMEYKLELNRM